MQHCVKKITPEFNTMVIFTTTDYNYHGLPSPLQCPPDKSRKSISLYYYSNGRPSHEINDGLEGFGILFKARKGNPEDNLVTSYNQKQAVKSYIKELTPPSILDFAKKIIGKEE
jgi:hypothetical protein